MLKEADYTRKTVAIEPARRNNNANMEKRNAYVREAVEWSDEWRHISRLHH